MTKNSAELNGEGLNLDYCFATKTQIFKNAAMKIMLKEMMDWLSSAKHLRNGNVSYQNRFPRPSEHILTSR